MFGYHLTTKGLPKGFGQKFIIPFLYAVTMAISVWIINPIENPTQVESYLHAILVVLLVSIMIIMIILTDVTRVTELFEKDGP